MFDAKSLLDTILGGQTAQQATAAAQSAGLALAGVAAQAEERLKGTAVGDAVTESKSRALLSPAALSKVSTGGPARTSPPGVPLRQPMRFRATLTRASSNRRRSSGSRARGRCRNRAGRSGDDLCSGVQPGRDLRAVA